MKKYGLLTCLLAIVFTFVTINPVHGSGLPSTSQVRRLARQPVDRILAGAPVEFITLKRYPQILRDTRTPLIAFFYGNSEPESQRVATLIRYLAPEYRGRIGFYAVRTASQGKPSQRVARDIARRYGVRSVPGVLFYDNPGQRLVLKQEEYIAADFKEFRTPRMFMWSTYHRVVKSELDKLLVD